MTSAQRSRCLLDTAVFLYALGRDHPYRQPCRDLVAAAAAGRWHPEVSVELLQEFAHVRARRADVDRATVVRETRDVASLCTVHEVTPPDFESALNLFRDHPALGMRDAIHAATALNRGVEIILSPDRAFDHVPGLSRVDPTEAEARLV